MKKRFFFVAAAALALLATACTKENEEPAPQAEKLSIPITLTAKYGNDSKVSYTEDGNAVDAQWEEDDRIIVCYDGDTSELLISGGQGTNTATFSGSIRYSAGTPSHEPVATTLLICYEKDKNATSEVTVDGRGAYHYTDNVFKSQDGTLAGAAKLNLYYGAAFYGDGSSITCNFSVNTSLMKFTLADVGSDNGNRATLAYCSNGDTVSKATFTVTSGSNTVWISIPAGAYTGEQKLVYKCGNNEEKPKVLSSSQANFVAGKTYSKNVIFVVPTGAIAGLFEVSDNGGTTTRQVFFSKGNLQATYGGSAWSWGFATNQWDYIGNAAANTSINGNSSVSASGTVDLFGWSTSTTYYGIHNSSNDGDYSGTFADWGDLAIVNGGNTENSGWRTLTANEWGHLLNDRTNASSKYGLGIVNGASGMILLPDDWTLPSGLTFTASKDSWADEYNSGEWAKMEAAGAVFLPAAGDRNSATVYDVGSRGSYWSSTPADGSTAYYTTFLVDNLGTDWEINRSYGFSVRLVRNL